MEYTLIKYGDDNFTAGSVIETIHLFRTVFKARNDYQLNANRTYAIISHWRMGTDIRATSV